MVVPALSAPRALDFYVRALGMRLHKQRASAAAATSASLAQIDAPPPKVTWADAGYGSGRDGKFAFRLSNAAELLTTVRPSFPPPLPTIAVSSLKTTSKAAARRWGKVLRPLAPEDPSAPLADGAGDEVMSCIVADPSGTAMRLVHRFSRTPVMSVAVQCSSVEASAAFYESVMPCRTVRHTDRGEAVLAFGPEDHTTSESIDDYAVICAVPCCAAPYACPLTLSLRRCTCVPTPTFTSRQLSY